jgi:hypothetical protein
MSLLGDLISGIVSGAVGGGGGDTNTATANASTDVEVNPTIINAIDLSPIEHLTATLAGVELVEAEIDRQNFATFMERQNESLRYALAGGVVLLLIWKMATK